MGKRELPPGQKCVRVNVSMTLAERAYLRRRAADARAAGEKHASLSGEIRKMTREAQVLRHDVPNARNAIRLTAELLRNPGTTRGEAADLLDSTDQDLAEKVAAAQQPPSEPAEERA